MGNSKSKPSVAHTKKPMKTPPYQLARPSYSQEASIDNPSYTSKPVVLCSLPSTSGSPPRLPSRSRTKKLASLPHKIHHLVSRSRHKLSKPWPTKPSSPNTPPTLPSSPNTPTTFHSFPLLPRELQLQIIEYALAPTQALYLGPPFFKAIWLHRHRSMCRYGSANYDMCQLRALLITGPKWGLGTTISFLSVNFVFRERALAELQRCVGEGMVEWDGQVRERLVGQIGELRMGIHPRFVRPKPIFEADRVGEGDCVLRSWRRVERGREEVRRWEWERGRGMLCHGEFWNAEREAEGSEHRV